MNQADKCSNISGIIQQLPFVDGRFVKDWMIPEINAGGTAAAHELHDKIRASLSFLEAILQSLDEDLNEILAPYAIHRGDSDFVLEGVHFPSAHHAAVCIAEANCGRLKRMIATIRKGDDCKTKNTKFVKEWQDRLKFLRVAGKVLPGAIERERIRAANVLKAENPRGAIGDKTEKHGPPLSADASLAEGEKCPIESHAAAPAVVKPSAWPPDAGWHFRPGEFAFNFVTGKCKGRVRQLLQFLVEQRHAVTRYEILEAVWGQKERVGMPVDDRNVKVHLTKVRDELRKSFGLAEEINPIPIVDHGLNSAWMLDESVLLPPKPRNRKKRSPRRTTSNGRRKNKS